MISLDQSAEEAKLQGSYNNSPKTLQFITSFLLQYLPHFKPLALLTTLRNTKYSFSLLPRNRHKLGVFSADYLDFIFRRNISTLLTQLTPRFLLSELKILSRIAGIRSGKFTSLVSSSISNLI